MIVHVDDPSAAVVADYRRLNDQSARRALEGDRFFIAEGIVSVERAVDSGHSLRSVLVTPSKVARVRDRLPRLVDGDVPLFVMERDRITELVGFDLHRGVVASADRRPIMGVAELAASGVSRVAILEGLNDAENVGVIARAARALWVEALVLDPTCTDPYSRRTVRVSMGEVLHLPVARSADWPGDLDVLHDAGFETWAMTPADDAVDLWDAVDGERTGRPDRLGILLGAEGPGLSPKAMAAASARVRIPIAEAVDSLNVGHAAAITFAALSH